MYITREALRPFSHSPLEMVNAKNKNTEAFVTVSIPHLFNSTTELVVHAKIHMHSNLVIYEYLFKEVLS